MKALTALQPGQIGVLTFPPGAGEDLNQWRANLWSAANQLRRTSPERGLLCTTVREDAAGSSLYFWYSADGEEDSSSTQGVGPFLQGYSVAEAAQVLGVSEKTIRRHIKAGRLAATLFNGPRGPEYRIESLELREPSAGQMESAVVVEQAAGPTLIETIASKKAETTTLTETPAAAIAQAELEGATTALVAELQGLLAAKDRQIEDLQQEKMQLAGQLGAVMERARHLEEQVKLLAAPAPKPKRSWWQRLLGRKG
jgi:excisionase family DNA binding protein